MGDTFIGERPSDAPFSRRSFLVAGAALSAPTAMLGLPISAARAEVVTGNHGIKEYDAATNDISLHVTEMGCGQPVIFCYGFPDTFRTWRAQMQAVASVVPRLNAVSCG